MPTPATQLTVLPTGTTTFRDGDGREITLSTHTTNRWQILETIGTLTVGRGELVAVNNTYAISSATGMSARQASWPDLLRNHLSDAA